MRAGVIGTNWGRVHVHALRCAGVEVHTLCGADLDKTRSIAAEEGVPHATNDPRELRHLDLVTIATPAATHLEMLRLFDGQAVICEKPLLGPGAVPAGLPGATGGAFVNYAFGFLETARVASARLADIGAVRRVRVHTSVVLPHPFTAEQWLLEAASHPFSWVLHQLGPVTVLQREVAPDAATVSLHGATGEAIEVRLDGDGEPGICHRVTVTGEQAELSFSGGFRPGWKWGFAPVHLDGAPVNDGEYTESDCWIDANVRAVGRMVEVFRGALPGAEEPLFDIASAARLEQALRSG